MKSLIDLILENTKYSNIKNIIYSKEGDILFINKLGDSGIYPVDVESIDITNNTVIFNFRNNKYNVTSLSKSDIDNNILNKFSIVPYIIFDNNDDTYILSTSKDNIISVKKSVF